MSKLVLSRKQGESVIIDDKIKLTFIRESKGVARFAIVRNGNTHDVLVPLYETTAIGTGGLVYITKPRLTARKIRIAFDADENQKIWREEIWQQNNGKRFEG